MPVIINGSGSITGLSVGGLPDGTVDADTLASGVGGKVLQVVSTTKKDVFSEAISAGGISADITGLTVSITPANASNKIFLMANLSIGSSTTSMTFYKDGSLLSDAIADAANKSYDGSALRRLAFDQSGGSHDARAMTGTFNDTAGGTSAITYSIRLHMIRADQTQTAYINRGNDSDEYSSAYPNDGRYISTFTAMEIAA